LFIAINITAFFRGLFSCEAFSGKLLPKGDFKSESSLSCLHPNFMAGLAISFQNFFPQGINLFFEIVLMNLTI